MHCTFHPLSYHGNISNATNTGIGIGLTLDHGRRWLIKASEQGDEENSQNYCKEGVLAELKSVRGGVFRLMNNVHPSSQGKMGRVEAVDGRQPPEWRC